MSGLIGINLNEIQERPLLAPGQYVFVIKEIAEVEKKDKTGTTLKATLVPEGFPDDTLTTYWGLSVKALSGRTANSSFKKFLEMLNLPLGDGSFDPQVVVGARFTGIVKHEAYQGEAQPKLDKIVGPAA